MTSRERVIATINHQEPDRVPFDLGGTHCSTFSARAYHNVREALGLEKKPCELAELFMFVAKVENDVREKLGIDTVFLPYPVDTNGCRTNRLQKFVGNDGSEAWIGADNKWDVLDDGSIVMYPMGDKSVAPSTIMIPKGTYFSNIESRLSDWDGEEERDAKEDWKDDFRPIIDEVAREIEEESIRLYRDTEYAVIGQFPHALLGDGAVTASPYVKNPKGIRKMSDFLAATIIYSEYVRESIEMQTENALRNLEIYKQAVGDRIQVLLLSTADYGAQSGPIISPDLFREMYKPYYKKLNDWIHQNTNWKVMYHCCGGITDLLDDYVDMGCDILNPIQVSAAGMDPKTLKERWGDKLVFWGGGADAQGCLTFGTPEEVAAQATERMEIFSPGGGFVFNPVHNIMPETKMENLFAMVEAVHKFNDARMK